MFTDATPAELASSFPRVDDSQSAIFAWEFCELVDLLDFSVVQLRDVQFLIAQGESWCRRYRRHRAYGEPRPLDEAVYRFLVKSENVLASKGALGDEPPEMSQTSADAVGATLARQFAAALAGGSSCREFADRFCLRP